MLFTPYMEICPEYDKTGLIPTSAYLMDGDILYLMGGTVLCKYDVSSRLNPKLLKRVNIAEDHTGELQKDYIRKGCAHATAIVDIGKYLVVSLRDGSGGVTNMADGVIVGNISIISKETLEKVKELNFENKVTYITKYKDLLIVSLHFHGFYLYKICDNTEILSCILKHIEIEKPKSTTTREFQNSMVFEVNAEKINIAMASYKNGISVYTYDLTDNRVSFCCELNPEVFPDMYDAETGVRNTVFGLTAKGNFVYGGITPGNNRFREQYKDVDWKRFDKRGIIYGSHNRLSEEYYHMELPDEDKPEYVGVIAGDPSPSFLCIAGSYLLFNLDKQGLGIARIEDDNKLTYIGRTLEDPDGRVLTYRIHYDGEFLYTSYKMPVANAEIPPVFRMFKVDLAK